MSEMRDVLRREIKVLAFDQYGTIVDMQKGLTEAVTPFLKQKGWDGKPNNFVTWWRRLPTIAVWYPACLSICDSSHSSVARPYRPAEGMTAIWSPYRSG
jgi:hypothetical protein